MTIEEVATILIKYETLKIQDRDDVFVAATIIKGGEDKEFYQEAIKLIRSKLLNA